MTSTRLPTTWARALRGAPLLGLMALLTALPSQAQYKVVGPDGKITYTDRPPPAQQGKATAISAKGGTASSDAVLPLELRQVVARYPVTLYAVTGACELCASARQLLRQRGIPFAEKQVMSPADTEALERLSGGRDVPTLSIGTQVLRGLQPDTWISYLDAAGYPKESRLPATYQYPTPGPITERVAAPAAVERTPQAAAAPAAPPAPSADNPTGIKF